MKYVKYLMLCFLFCITLNVKALDSCTTDEMNRLKELAGNVEFKYNYEISNEYIAENAAEENFVEGVFKIQVLNHNEDLRYVLQYDGSEFEINGNDLSSFSFDEGETITFKIYSYTTNLCTHNMLKTYTIKLPYYNQYYHYNKDKCESNQEFEYCKEYLDKYTGKSISEIDEEFEKNKNDGLNIVSELPKNNIVIIIISLIVVLGLGIGGVVVYSQYKKRKKDDL
ncbi:MAG: hypothetical protein IJ068_01140 [Bacilli bacterium]|nr:hypothetical protein [Bacilli bacterium]